MLRLCECVTELNREGQLYDLEQDTGALCERGAASLFEGSVLDLVTASFTESYFTTHHLSDKNIQINLILFLRVVMVKCHMPMKILRNLHKLIWLLSIFPWNGSQGWVLRAWQSIPLFTIKSCQPISWNHLGHLPFSHLCPTEEESRIQWLQAFTCKEMFEIYHKWGILQLWNFTYNLVQQPPPPHSHCQSKCELILSLSCLSKVIRCTFFSLVGMFYINHYCFDEIKHTFRKHF